MFFVVCCGDRVCCGPVFRFLCGAFCLSVWEDGRMVSLGRRQPLFCSTATHKPRSAKICSGARVACGSHAGRSSVLVHRTAEPLITFELLRAAELHKDSGAV